MPTNKAKGTYTNCLQILKNMSLDVVLTTKLKLRKELLLLTNKKVVSPL